MKRRSAIRNLVVAGAASLSSRLMARVSPEQPQDFIIRSDVRLVLLDVSVKDRHGGLVPGLTQSNFVILENGEPQTITVFASRDVPVTIGLLIDESRSMRSKRADVLSAAETLIETSNPLDEIFVLNFNDVVKHGLPDSVLFSDNLDQLRAALERGTPQGRTALNDAVAEGLQQLALGKREKKALVLLSDGGDNASRSTAAEMFSLVERSIATIYAVGLFDAQDEDRNPGILNRLAHISGGEAFFPPSASSAVAICRLIAKDIRTRYTVGYLPPANHGPLRHIQARVWVPGRSGLVAHTRTRYRYEESLPSGGE